MNESLFLSEMQTGQQRLSDRQTHSRTWKKDTRALQAAPSIQLGFSFHPQKCNNVSLCHLYLSLTQVIGKPLAAGLEHAILQSAPRPFCLSTIAEFACSARLTERCTGSLNLAKLLCYVPNCSQVLQTMKMTCRGVGCAISSL